jgi:hypothetical protein
MSTPRELLVVNQKVRINLLASVQIHETVSVIISNSSRITLNLWLIFRLSVIGNFYHVEGLHVTYAAVV